MTRFDAKFKQANRSHTYDKGFCESKSKKSCFSFFFLFTCSSRHLSYLTRHTESFISHTANDFIYPFTLT